MIGGDYKQIKTKFQCCKKIQKLYIFIENI